MRLLRGILNRVPFTALVPIFYLVSVLSILLYIVLSPLIYLYGLMLCSRVWIEWAKQGKDVLVVHTDGEHTNQWLPRLRLVVGNRAVFLNYNERDRWTLSAQLFGIFGPHAMPERFTPGILPAVMVFKRLRLPRKFTFGERSKGPEEKLEQLRSELI
jgi:hypothetical protein